MKNRYKILIGSVIVFVIIIFICMLQINSKTSSEESSNEKTTYQCEYYSVEVPSNWKQVKISDGQINYELKNNNVAGIETSTGFQFEKTTSSIVDNYLGMHAYAKGDSMDTDYETYTMKKILVGWEQPIPAEERGDPPEADELYYFYFPKNTDLYMVLSVYTNKVTDKEADEIANSVKINNKYLK